MANDPKYDSGTVIVPVAHPADGVHNIEVPADLPVEELHDALASGGYLHDVQPTKEGALEYSDAFRKAARDAVGASRNFSGNESGFAVDANSQPGRIQTTLGPATKGASHHLKITAPSNAQATLHTHPARTGSDTPSDEDVQNAKNLHHTVYVASQAGLFAIDPGGSVTHVFKNEDWMTKRPRE